MASDQAHELVRKALLAAGNPAGNRESYAAIKPVVDRALGWMSGPDIVSYLGVGSGDWVDAADALDQRISGYVAAQKAANTAVSSAAAVQKRMTSAGNKANAAADEAGFARPFSSGGGGSSSSSDGGGGGTAAPSATTDPYLEALKKGGYFPVPGRPGVFFSPETGKEYDSNADVKRAGNDGSAWGAIAENRRQFDTTQARLAGRDVVGDAQWQTAYDEGTRQFQQTYDRGVFASDRSYQQAQDQFAANFAENTRQFDTTFGEGQRQFDTRLGSEESRFAADMGLRADTTRAQLGLSAEGMAGEQSRFDRTASLAEQQNRQQVLRGPSDFISRAFEARGETSPTSRVTHADLINSVAAEAAAAKASGAETIANARRIAASVTTPTWSPPTRMAAQPPPARLPVVPPAARAPVPVPVPTPAWVEDGGSARMSNGVSPLTRTGTPDWVTAAPATAPAQAVWQPSDNAATQAAFDRMNSAPRLGEGGHTQANMVMIGDAPKGEEGKENEELVIDLPNDGGLLVIPKDRLVGKRKRMADAAPKAAGGGYFDTAFSTPGTQVSQEDITGAARRFAPPAVRDAVAGSRIAPFRAAVPGLTPRRVGFMNSGEQEALNAYLGVVENTTLQDELGGLRSTFGPAVSRPRARFVSQV